MIVPRGLNKIRHGFIVLAIAAFLFIAFEFYEEIPFHWKLWIVNSIPNQGGSPPGPTSPTYCTNLKTAIKFGHWRPKPALTARDQEARASQDVFLRRHRGLPDHFLRNDLRCGTSYPINAPAFGPRLPSMCDSNSLNHCCNATNWCSSGTSNCACAGCTDFRKIVSAELHEWTPNDNCHLHNYTSEKACSLVNHRLSSLVIMGDSLMRHFYVALLLIFTNDPLEGSIKKTISKKKRKRCLGERQFVDGGKSMCHMKLARSNREVNDKKFCKGNTDFYFHFNESHAINRRDHAMKIVRETVKKRSKSLIVVGVGLHDGCNPQKIMTEYVDPILRIIGSRTWTRIVWVTIHAMGYLKPMAYRGNQNNAKILAYNQQMTKLMEAKGIDVLDFFSMTSGVHSYDGTHYGYGVNMAKAHFLLNYIESTVDS